VTGAGAAAGAAGADCLIAVGDPGTTTLLVSSLRAPICPTAFAITASAFSANPDFFRMADWASAISALNLSRSSLRGSEGLPPAYACRIAAITAKLANAANVPRMIRGPPREGELGAVSDMDN